MELLQETGLRTKEQSAKHRLASRVEPDRSNVVDFGSWAKTTDEYEYKDVTIGAYGQSSRSIVE